MATRLLLFQVFFGILTTTSATPLYKRNAYKFVNTNNYDDTIFGLGNDTYLANTQHPKVTFNGDFESIPAGELVPITAITTNESVITRSLLQNIISSYGEADDVFTEDFLEAFYISAIGSAVLDKSAVNYLSSINIRYLFLSPSFNATASNIAGAFTTSVVAASASPPRGPFVASINAYGVSLMYVYKLYRDVQQTFLHGAYSANDGNGTYNSLGFYSSKFPDPMIPVPSRIHSWGDDRPLAGERVAIKDLYDLKGMQTSGGSRAWALITPIANGTAPSVQQIIDLGGQIVGKQKLAQFASGANPWDWQDEQYPFNPRGDGWLTCSASSSGGGCSIAAYDWLDYAIGSDTGSSMRRPAAVSGVYGQRPSQGMISLDRVIPLGGATDTAGVFSRDPYKWIKFAKNWYSPGLHQSSEETGLSPLMVPDTDAFPKRILYPIDYLPLNNSAAEPILDEFIANMSRIFNMTVEKFNFTATVESWNDTVASNLTTLISATSVINSWTQWSVIANPLITAWNALFDGRFPPIDSARRSGWANFNVTRYNADTYSQALATKNRGVEWYEKHLQYSTSESCSESVMLYDIGSGGLPSFREEHLNDSPAASYLAVLPPGAAITGANICPIFGCADFTVPIGQVPYFSNVTFHEEMVPVTIGMVVKRGCDFVLYNMIEKLADEGVLKTVKTGRTAF